MLFVVGSVVGRCLKKGEEIVMEMIADAVVV
jgi:hypothetical protein